MENHLRARKPKNLQQTDYEHEEWQNITTNGCSYLEKDY